MEQICTLCAVANRPEATSCEECTTSFTTPYKKYLNIAVVGWQHAGKSTVAAEFANYLDSIGPSQNEPNKKYVFAPFTIGSKLGTTHFGFRAVNTFGLGVRIYDTAGIYFDTKPSSGKLKTVVFEYLAALMTSPKGLKLGTNICMRAHDNNEAEFMGDLKKISNHSDTVDTVPDVFIIVVNAETILRIAHGYFSSHKEVNSKYIDALTVVIDTIKSEFNRDSFVVITNCDAPSVRDSLDVMRKGVERYAPWNRLFFIDGQKELIGQGSIRESPNTEVLTNLYRSIYRQMAEKLPPIKDEEFVVTKRSKISK